MVDDGYEEDTVVNIDIHAHTRKCKSGDAPTRDIAPEDFCKTVLSTDVGIIAITNHNVFDLEQFKEIETGLGHDAQVWPGIELDIVDGELRGHLLLIVSPKSAGDFSVAVEELTKDSTPDQFAATVDDVLAKFDSLNPLYVAHYQQKMPCLSEASLERLLTGTKNPGRVIKEVTNSISAGIYISHGHASIHGSDVHDWAKYEELAQELPDLRLPVDSFEHFCLLLEKDPTTINTVLDRKTSEDLELCPFGDDSVLSVKAFNDINVIFGPKGTGKSCVLKAIAKHYTANGVDAKVYAPASDRLDEIYDTKGSNLSINLNTYEINYCTDQIKALRIAREVDVASLGKYVGYFEAKSTNRNAKKILLKDISLEGESGAEREFKEVHEALKKTRDFVDFLTANQFVKDELDKEEHEHLTRILSALHERLAKRSWASFAGWKEIHFLNSAIRTFQREVERKTGSPAKPTTTGFRDYALNRMKIEVAAAEIVKSINTEIPPIKEHIGSLGTSKGELELRTEYKFQTGHVTDGRLSSLSHATKKGPQKKFAQCINMILEHAYADDLFQHVSDLNTIEDAEAIRTVLGLLLFKRYFSLDGAEYTPSSGEASMVMLQKELGTDKDVYILDEPERSLGNEYISDVIVPLIKERARAGKKVFIATHDANIAVRTLPYSSVYRHHGPEGYRTYTGNPFSNNLVNSDDENDRLDWKSISMRTLEGGEEAFGERGRIYGNT